MDKKTILAMLLRDGLKSLAGALVFHGWLASGATEAFIGAGMLVASSLWSFWVTSGRTIAQASLEILQAKVLNAAAKARQNPAAAPAAIASVAAHVEATTPAGAPAGSAAASVAIMAIGLMTLSLMGGGSAYAQTPAPRPPTRGFVPTGNLPLDIQNAKQPADEPKLTGDPIADLHAVIQKGGQKLILHLKQTYALASAPGPDGAMVDPVSAPCAKALVPIVDLVVNGPKMGVIVAPDPMAFSADEATLNADASQIEGLPVKIEKLRILRISLSSPALTIACGPLVQDEVKQAKNLAGGIASLMTGAGLLGVGL